MILVDSNIWVFFFDEAIEPEHGRATRWLRRWLEKADLLVPAIVETEVIHYLARQLEPAAARDAVGSFLAHPGVFAPLGSAVNRRAADLLIEHPDRGIGGRDATLLVHADQTDATVVTHDQALLSLAREMGLDAHDPVAAA